MAVAQLVAETEAATTAAAEATSASAQASAAAGAADMDVDMQGTAPEKSSKRKAEDEPVAESSKKARVDDAVKLKRYVSEHVCSMLRSEVGSGTGRIAPYLLPASQPVRRKMN